MAITDSTQFGKMSPFRFWCQKVLPAVYDDSLSYYELLCKVADYINKLIEVTNTQSDAITELQETLAEFMAGTFDPYIEEKVDEWFQTHEPTLYNDVEDLKEKVDDLEDAMDAAEDDIDNLQEDAVMKKQTNLNAYTDVELVHTFSYSNESFQSIDNDGTYLYVLSISGANNTVTIRKVDSSYQIIDSYQPTFKAHGNSLCVFNNKAYITGIYHDGSTDYSQVGVYNLSDGTEQVLTFPNIGGLYSLATFQGTHGQMFIGITGTGSLIQMFKSPLNNHITIDRVWNVEETNGICQDSFFNNDIYYQLIGSRYNQSHAAPNCLMAYSYNGELVGCRTLIEDETGNSYPYNEGEGITYMNGKVYMISAQGLLYSKTMPLVVLPTVNSVTGFKQSLLNVFGFQHKYVMNGNLMEKIYCSPNFALTGLTEIIGTAQIANHIVPVVYNHTTGSLIAEGCFPWHQSATYYTMWHVAWVRSVESDTYVYTVDEIWLGTNYGGTYQTISGWDAIQAADFGGRTIEIRELLAIYNGNPNLVVTVS